MKTNLTKFDKAVFPVNMVIAACILFFLLSCGARKVDRNSTSEIVKIDSSNVSIAKIKDSIVKTDDSKITIKESFYEPIDATKPASVVTPDGKKHELNNAKLKTKEIVKNNVLKSIKSVSGSIKKNNTYHLDSKKITDIKKIDKKAWSIWNLLWLLIPICIGYLIWRNKDKFLRV